MSVDVMRARVAFRERPFLDVLDLALRFLVSNARLYARVALVVLLPSLAVTYTVARLGGWWAGWICAVVLGFAAQVPFTILASRLVFEDEVRARAALRAALSDLPRVLVMRVLWTLAVGVALVLLILPAGWVASVLGFTSEAMLLERAPIGAAFGRSNRVAASALPDALLVLFMTMLLPAFGILLADLGGRQLLGELFQLQPPDSMFGNGGSFLALFGWFAILPYVTTARFFVYLNVRTRVEGWDVQTRFAALASRAEQIEQAEAA